MKLKNLNKKDKYSLRKKGYNLNDARKDVQCSFEEFE